MIVCQAPYRITLAGGGTDRPEFYQKHGGSVISMAIDKYLYTTIKDDDLEKKFKLRYSKSETVDKINDLQHERAKAVLNYFEIKKPVEIVSCGDIPSNTGMGSSGTYLVSLIKACCEFTGKSTPKSQIAANAYILENRILNYPVGFQDQYISAFGGLKKFTAFKNSFFDVVTDDIVINDSVLQRFINNFQIFYLGQKREANDVLEKTKCDDSKKEDIMLKILNSVNYVEKMFQNMEGLDAYGFYLDQYWGLKKQLSNSVSSDTVDGLYEFLKKEYGILGGKIIGAGGSGFFGLYCNKKHIEVEKFMLSKGYKKLNYNIDKDGAKTLFNG